MSEVNFFWFRRDLRLQDNRGLAKALKSKNRVCALFIFDINILDQIDNKLDARVDFIHQALVSLHQQLKEYGSGLLVRFGKPEEVWMRLLEEYEIGEVHTNHDYEPYARERDVKVADLLKSRGVGFESYKDQVIFEKLEVSKDDGSPYTVFTPYSRKWKAVFALTQGAADNHPIRNDNFYLSVPDALPTLHEIGFSSSGKSFPSTQWDNVTVGQYNSKRDFPAVDGTTRLGMHLRFGTISVRQLVREAGILNETFLNELIWREFYQMILYNFPQVGQGKSFKPVYDQIQWRNNENEFKRWSVGETGYPIVDAGMRQLNETGYMHNRVRMIVASFLTKHLLIDWRWGEAYFASKLLDFDLAANNGGWQWAAGSGCDAAPYFRVFNPTLQTQKFDSNFEYIRKWVPEFEGFSYPKPIVVHEFARKRCLEVYGEALGKGSINHQ